MDLEENTKIKESGSKVHYYARWRGKWKFPGNNYSAVAVWRELRPKKEKVAWHRLIWSPFVVPKHAIIAWMAILNRLPTKDRLRRWGLVMDGECPLCKHEQETRNHLFFECSYSKAIWKMILQQCRLGRDVRGWSYELTWAIQKLKGKSLISILLTIGWNALIYQVWRERNNRLFKQKEETTEQIMEKIEDVVRHRTAKLRNVATDAVNMALHRSWGLFEPIFDSA